MQAKVQKHRMNRGLIARPFRVCVAVCALVTALCVNLYAQARPDILWARSGPGRILAFSPDRRFVVMDSKLVRISDRMVIRVFAQEVSSAAFSPDRATLALVNKNTVRLVRVSDGTLLHTLSGHTASVRAVAFSPDGTLLASGSGDNTVRLWRVSDGTHLRTLSEHTGSVNAVAFSPDGTRLASGSSDNTIRLWRVSDGVRLRLLQGHANSVSAVAFSPDGAQLASSSEDNTVRLWRVSDGMHLRTIPDSGGVVFSPDGSGTLAVSSQRGVRLWRASDGTRLRALTHGYGYPPYIVAAFSQDGSRLYSGVFEEIALWRVSDGHRLSTVRFTQARQVELCMENPSILLSDNLLVRTMDGVVLRDFVTFGANFSQALSPNGRVAVFAGSSGVVSVFDTASGDLINYIDDYTFGPGMFISSELRLAFSQDSSQFVVSGYSIFRDYDWDENGNYREYEIGQRYFEVRRSSNGSLIQRIPDTAFRAQFVPNSPLIAFATSSNSTYRIHLYDMNTRTVVRTLHGHDNVIDQLAVSPDGRFIASSSRWVWSPTVRIWRVSDGALLYEYNFRAYSLAFTADSQFLAAGGDDGIMFWRLSDGALVQSYTAPEARNISSLSLAPNLMVYAQSDGTLVLARLSLERRSLFPVPLR